MNIKSVRYSATEISCRKLHKHAQIHTHTHVNRHVFPSYNLMSSIIFEAFLFCWAFDSWHIFRSFEPAQCIWLKYYVDSGLSEFTEKVFQSPFIFSSDDSEGFMERKRTNMSLLMQSC